MRGIKLLVSLIFLLGISCSTEVEVNAPYEDVTVVYGLLDANQTAHYIKVNKAFLGPADAFEMAQVRDSSEYENINVELSIIKNGTITSTIILRDTVLSNKKPGVFYGPAHTLYYFTRELDGDANYELTISNKNKKTTATTAIIKPFEFSGGRRFLVNSGISLVNANESSNTLEFEWAAVENAVRYELGVDIHYTNKLLDGTNEDKVFQWNIATQVINGTTSSTLEQDIFGEDFYQQIAANINPIAEDINVKHRTFSHLEFHLSLATDDLNTYVLVNEPATGILQEKPEFTNVENGIGIFSSRTKQYSESNGTRIQVKLNTTSMNELYNGKYTKDRGFCAESGPFQCD